MSSDSTRVMPGDLEEDRAEILQKLEQCARNLRCFMCLFIVLDAMVVSGHAGAAWSQESFMDALICAMFTVDIILAVIMMVSFSTPQVSVKDDWWEKRGTLIQCNLVSNILSLLMLGLCKMTMHHKHHAMLYAGASLIVVCARLAKLTPLHRLYKVVLHASEDPSDHDRYVDLIAEWSVKDYACEKLLVKMVLASVAILVVLFCLAAVIDDVVGKQRATTPIPTAQPSMMQASVPQLATPSRRLLEDQEVVTDTTYGGTEAGTVVGVGVAVVFDIAGGAAVGGPIGAAVGAVIGFVTGVGIVVNS